MAPAWKSLKTDLVPALKNTESGQGARHRLIGRSALVVTQVALAMVLLVVTAGILDGFRKVLVTDPGFRTDHLLLAGLDTSTVGYSSPGRRPFTVVSKIACARCQASRRPPSPAPWRSTGAEMSAR